MAVRNGQGFFNKPATRVSPLLIEDVQETVLDPIASRVVVPIKTMFALLQNRATENNSDQELSQKKINQKANIEKALSRVTACHEQIETILNQCLTSSANNSPKK